MRLQYQLPGITAFETPTAALTAPDQVVSTDITLPPSVFTTVRGRAVAGDGVTPVSANVAFTYEGGNVGTSAGGDGRFEIRIGLPVSGTFTVRVSSSNNAAVFVEQSHTATTQGEVVDLGDILLPISVLSGRVTYGVATPVPYPNVFARHTATNNTYFPDSTDIDGDFIFTGLPAGTYDLTGSDADGLEATIPVTLDTDSSVITTANVLLPEIATLNINVIDRAGNDAQYVNVVVSDGGDFERYLGWFYDATSGGSFSIQVPLGDFTVAGEVLTCTDPFEFNTCTGLGDLAFVQVSAAEPDIRCPHRSREPRLDRHQQRGRHRSRRGDGVHWPARAVVPRSARALVVSRATAHRSGDAQPAQRVAAGATCPMGRSGCRCAPATR